MRHLDLFSGIGGFALAASRTWGDEYKNVGHCEIEEYACKVYHKHFPDSKCLGDITKVKWNEGQADIITGGFPCQPHSQAGKRLASKDERDLWYECKRAVSEIRPRYALFENVAGLLTSERGGFFNRVLSDLAEIGYDAEWDIIPASALGAPHRRERVWLISYPNEIRSIHWKSKIITTENGFNALGNTSAIHSAIRETIPYAEQMGRENRTAIRGRNAIRRTPNIFDNIHKTFTETDWNTAKSNYGYFRKQGEREFGGYDWGSSWVQVAVSLCGMDDGLSGKLDENRKDRLAALGNAIVPQVAQIIMEAIKEDDEHSNLNL
jgi:DNA-cytosine methyltransferase